MYLFYTVERRVLVTYAERQTYDLTSLPTWGPFGRRTALLYMYGGSNTIRLLVGGAALGGGRKAKFKNRRVKERKSK